MKLSSKLSKLKPVFFHDRHKKAKSKKTEEKQMAAGRSRTIGSRLFTYFTAFTVAIMLVLWILQVLFLQTFYQEMKIRELYKVADTIEECYGQDDLLDTISNLTVKSDMYIQILMGDKLLYASTIENPADRMNIFAQTYNYDSLKLRLHMTGNEPVVIRQPMPQDKEAEVMIYGSILEKGGIGENTYLFIYTPLTVLGSTVEILAKMLITITFIAILFGVIMSVFISRRLARPIYDIADSANLLAKGDYSVVFDGGGYAETEELADTLNYVSDELQKTDRLQKDILANVTHDLKTPLTMVKSYAEMIRDISGDNPEKRNKHLQVIINEADRLNSLVNDLTVLSKMQASVGNLSLSTVDLTQIARETLDSFSIHAEQEGFVFQLQTYGNTTVIADEAKIRQVFANLIGNAVRYSNDNKLIIVSVKEQPHAVRCEIIDHGQGIAPSELDAIWNRYYQSSANHSRNTKGSGLGLSIVKQIFILHRAKHGVTSRLNEGSTFWFELKK
ncbi:MAG: HAMP domain-containing histidine kinase [Firmicutes bacterium]|nr:HAMP domain-containing histidine kinase [Bacillota bacterium]